MMQMLSWPFPYPAPNPGHSVMEENMPSPLGLPEPNSWLGAFHVMAANFSFYLISLLLALTSPLMISNKSR